MDKIKTDKGEIKKRKRESTKKGDISKLETFTHSSEVEKAMLDLYMLDDYVHEDNNKSNIKTTTGRNLAELANLL